jgi:hypothetical protein
MLALDLELTWTVDACLASVAECMGAMRCQCGILARRTIHGTDTTVVGKTVLTLLAAMVLMPLAAMVLTLLAALPLAMGDHMASIGPITSSLGFLHGRLLSNALCLREYVFEVEMAAEAGTAAGAGRAAGSVIIISPR